MRGKGGGGGGGAAAATVAIFVQFLAFTPTIALAGTPVSLRDHPESHGRSVTLGDLFDGAEGTAAGVKVGQAVPNGGETVLDAARVQTAADAAGLEWGNEAGVRRIVVASLAAETPPPRATHPSSTRTRAAAQATTPAHQALAWARNIQTGEIIGPSDLIWSNEAVAPQDAPADPDAITGKQARRPLRSGAAASQRDLANPRVIKREESVAVLFETDGISLTLQGKAMGDAAVGDTLQVLNPQSKKVIEAVASGPGQAVTGPRADQIRAAQYAPGNQTFATAFNRQ